MVRTIDRQWQPDPRRNLSVRPCRRYDDVAAIGVVGRHDVLPRYGMNGGAGDTPGRDHDLCWIAECDGAVAGYVRLVRDADGSARVTELRLGWRGGREQLAAVLLHAVIAHCRRSACVRIVLEADVDADLAVAIFSAHGFQWHRRRGGLAFYVNLYCEPERRARPATHGDASFARPALAGYAV